MYKRCVICGNYFPAMVDTRKYCSDKCAANKKYYVKKKQLEKECNHCGSIYYTCRSNQRFCSDICKNKFHDTRTAQNKVCLRCKKPFNTTNNSRKYCGGECYLIAKRVRDKIAYQKRRAS